MRTSTVAFGALVLLTASCDETAPPRDQWVVVIDTDAPAPRLVDRARIDLLVDGAAGLASSCDTCTREIALDAETSWPISFGVPAGSATFVRVRLFPAGRVQSSDGTSLPLSGTAIDRVVRLVAATGGVERVRAHLPFACAGRVADLVARESCTADGGFGAIVAAPLDDGAASRVGTVDDEVDVPCVGAASADTGALDGEVCIRGGAFWMGDARGLGFGPAIDGWPEHAVLVSSFFLDTHEFTIDRLARAGQPDRYVNQVDAMRNVTAECVRAPGGTQAAVCVQQSIARSACESEGRRLPTEAELEWASGARERETRFPWGDVLTGDCGTPGPARAADTCPELPLLSPLPVGFEPRSTSPEGVFDLSGNVMEWTSDRYDPYTGDCWRPGLYSLRDPRCEPRESDTTAYRVARGGSNRDGGPYNLPAAARVGLRAGTRYGTVGFRCARDAR